MVTRCANRLASVALLAVLLAVVGTVGAEPPELVSVNLTGTDSGDGRSFSPAISADGRYVLFISHAQDLVADPVPGPVQLYRRDLVTGETVHVSVNDPPYDVGYFNGRGISDDGNRIVYERTGSNPFGPTDVFVRDVDAGVTLLVSADLGGLPAFGRSSQISGDGNFVSFVTSADLVVNDGNSAEDVFVRDLDAGVTKLVSVNLMGTAAGGAYPSISADGRFVSFSSPAKDLVEVDGNIYSDAFLRDLSTGTTRLVSRAMGGGGGNNPSGAGPISADGRRIVFTSTATDLIPGGGGFFADDVFVYDVASGDLQLASVNLAGTGGGNSTSFVPVLSPDGSHVVFTSWASNLTAEVINAGPNVFVRDLDAGVTTLVSIDASGAASGNASSGASFGRPLSADHRFVVFTSSANNLVTGVTYDCGFPCTQVYQRDLVLGTTELLSCDANGDSTTDLPAKLASTSADGRVVAFQSDADDLSPLDANGETDVFVSGQPLIAAPAVPALSHLGLALLIGVLLTAGWRLVR